jgi:hypothetical protein
MDGGKVVFPPAAFFRQNPADLDESPRQTVERGWAFLMGRILDLHQRRRLSGRDFAALCCALLHMSHGTERLAEAAQRGWSPSALADPPGN